MRRFLPILLMAFFMLVMILAGTTYLSSFAGNTNVQHKEQVTVYTTLPLEYTTLLAQEYERTRGIQIRLVPLVEHELAGRLKSEADNPEADLVLTSQAALEQTRRLGLLRMYVTEQTDIIPPYYKNADQYWTGLWYDPIVFAVNQDYLKKSGQVPSKWSDLAQDGKLRLAMTDFLAADAAANLLFSLTMENGETQTLGFLKKIHPQIVQYAKFLSTPVRIAGMGECDIAIAVQSETLRYKAEGFPLSVIYPEEGTAYMLTGAALIKNSSHSKQAGQFLDWLLQQEAQQILEKNRFYLVSVNPEHKKYRDYTQKSLKLFDKGILYTSDERYKLLDKWVQTVRLGR